MPRLPSTVEAMRIHLPIGVALVAGSLVAVLASAVPGVAAEQGPKVIGDQQIRMSDGVVLVGEVQRPAASGRWPVILKYTPFGRGDYTTRYVGDGYVHLNVQARGTGHSGGENCIVCRREQQDAVELIEWAAGQPWSSGRVGMIGGSYPAFIQLLAAAKKPPGLKAIVPRVSWSDPYRDAWYHNGLFNYAVVTGFTVAQPALSLTGLSADPALLPLLLNQRQRPPAIVLAKRHRFDGPFYRERAVYNKAHKIEVPALFIGGWFDMFVAGMANNFTGVRSRHKRLIMGPWTHRRAGDIPEFFPEPYPDVHLPSPDPVLAWYDRFLKRIPNDAEDEPRVLYFDVGVERWVESRSWPPPRARLAHLFLSGAHSQSIGSLNDGSLKRHPPDTKLETVPDRYRYDPTTGLGEATSSDGAVFLTPFRRLDQRVDEVRGLTYTTPVLSDSLALAGPMELTLWAETSAADTDWVVKVSDVQPDGTSLLLSSGYVRATQRAVDRQRSRPGEPWLRNTRADPVPQHRAVRYRIPIEPVGVTLPEGHRLRVAIYSADIAVHEPLLISAANTVYHDADHPSVLRFTVARDTHRSLPVARP